MARTVVGATSSSPEEIRGVFFASIVGAPLMEVLRVLAGMCVVSLVSVILGPETFERRVRRAETAPAASSSPP